MNKQENRKQDNNNQQTEQQQKNKVNQQQQGPRPKTNDEPVDERSAAVGNQSDGQRRDPEIDMPANEPEKTERKIPKMSE